jgi:hypothetical protein
MVALEGAMRRLFLVLSVAAVLGLVACAPAPQETGSDDLEAFIRASYDKR